MQQQAALAQQELQLRERAQQQAAARAMAEQLRRQREAEARAKREEENIRRAAQELAYGGLSPQARKQLDAVGDGGARSAKHQRHRHPLPHQRH